MLLFRPVDTQVLLFLFGVAVVAGFIDTLAGGGGLIALPALIMSGVPPLYALGTNKLQGSMGTATAAFLMLSTGRVKWKDARLLILYALLGSVAGTIFVQFIDPSVLSFLIPLVLVVIVVYFAFAPKPKGQETVRSLAIFRRVAVPGIGAYDGMFGPGTGSFFAFAGVALRGRTLVEATAFAKTLNFATNIASLCVFLIAGKVMWLAGGVMIFGQLIGAYLGSHCLFRIKPELLKTLVIVMCLGMLVKYGNSEGWW